MANVKTKYYLCTLFIMINNKITLVINNELHTK